VPKQLYIFVERFRDAALCTAGSNNAAGWCRTDWCTFPPGWNINVEHCFQVMETDDRRLIDQWMANWSDIVDFEVYPVMGLSEATTR
jgi:hypothetical protein